MRRVIAIAVLAACSGRGGGPVVPQGSPSVRLVGCAPATPFPAIGGAPDDGSELDELETTGWGSSGRGPGTGALHVGERARVTLGLPTSSSGIDGDRIAAAVRGKLDDLTRCYANDLVDASPSKAVVTYRFSITTNGSVDVHEPTTRTLSRSLDGCVRRVLRTMAFPPPRTGVAVSVSYPLVFDATGPAPASAPRAPVVSSPWTPFSRDSSPAVPAASGAARAAEAAMHARTGELAKCFTGARPTGSLRLMLDLDVMGDLDAVRVGGLGDAAAEACVARALAGFHVVAPKSESVELACDLARGDARPWRVAPAGYGVIAVDRARVRHRADSLAAGTTEPAPLPSATYLVVARHDTPGAMLHLALAWARQADAALVALDDGGAAPVFVGIGQTGSASDDGELVHAAVRVGPRSMVGCVGRAHHEAKLTDVAGLGGLLQRMATRCKSARCAPTLLVAVEDLAVMRDVVEVTGAARRAGWERVLLAKEEHGCQQGVDEPQRRQRPRVPDFEDEDE